MAEPQKSKPDTGVAHGDTGRGNEGNLISPRKVIEDKSDAGENLENMTDTSERTEMEWEQLYPTVEVSRKATEGTENQEESAAVEEDGLSPGVATEAKEEKGEGEEEGEEGREAVAMPSPLTPSRKEREQHELTHTPYRSWCLHCVRARGRTRTHRGS